MALQAMPSHLRALVQCRRVRRSSRRLCAAAAAVLLASCACLLEAFAIGGQQVPGRRQARVARRSEAFDPFGWKGGLKETLQSFIGGGEPEEPPSLLDEQMMLEIFRKFDVDQDGILNLEEFNSLQLATEGQDAVYNLDQLKSLLYNVNSDLKNPDKGMPFSEYRRLYVERRLRQSYNTDISRDHAKIFGPDGINQSMKVVQAIEEAAAAASIAALQPGVPVRIAGLSGAVELNGQDGVIAAPVDEEAMMVSEGRIIVQLPSGERVALKPTNIQVVTTAVE